MKERNVNITVGTILTIIGVMIAASVLMFTIYINLDSKIDKKVEEKFKDPVFINKLAEEIKFPFVIFDEDNSVVVDTGAMSIIEKITINKKDGKQISDIIITPKKYLAIAPILESLDPDIAFLDPIRGNKFDFIYKKLEVATAFANTYTTKPPKSKFRIQVIVLSKGN
jgi:hypothetical protein